MKPSNFTNVPSKVQINMREKRKDDTPEALKSKNLRYLEENNTKKKEKKKPTKSQRESLLLSPVRQSTKGQQSMAAT
eukprot:CAMPEP_0202977990 /NCGR_PEP_ID=MMETSP1396-20130829/84579_1 /ASSEMBLY_ACC=CAM_ASM_000872 /TAXON_ID= /ORGANISM="Pseudokeronopsis sp., Strain Brazil" /LENGTH=76 /DNA_ID=CAMNT_0049716845 /DNA_START=275 /DNA_END=505 /DNA_ORIENTATION=+